MDTNGRDMSTRTCVCLYNQPVTWIFTKSRLSSLSDSDYKVTPSLKFFYLIIVVFSCPHFSIYDIFYTLENTRSFNEKATHFNFGYEMYLDILPLKLRNILTK